MPTWRPESGGLPGEPDAPPLDPPWEPLGGGGIGATMPRWARSWAWKGGAVREWREGGPEGARCQAGVMLLVLDPREWAEVRRRGPIPPGDWAALRDRLRFMPPAAPVSVEQPMAAHLADDSDWTRGIWWGATVEAAEVLVREDLWRFGPPHGGKTGRIVRMDGDGEEDG